MKSLSDSVMKIYNTMYRKKEKFKPVHGGEVRMYSCGPTVYNYIHIGNARPLIFFDVVRRYFEYCGYSVTYVQNITDIDDKIIAQAIKENAPAEKIAKRYTGSFLDDCEELGVRPPDESPRATEYVGEMIRLIKALVDKGHAYEAAGNVFFEAGTDLQYGVLSGKDLNRMESSERVDDEIQSLKRDPRDFSLWKPSKPGEPFWESPWGKGRPGWHTECVVMSTKILGREFDIHTGGVDLIFPHHENELAQARCGLGAKFARYWMHNEFVNLKEKKMAKSEGNVVLVKDLVKKYRPEAIRYFFLQTHYRKTINFSEEIIESCQNAMEKRMFYYSGIVRRLKEAQKKGLKDSGGYFRKDFKNIPDLYQGAIQALDSDFNTAIASSNLLEILDLTHACSLQISGRGATRDLCYIVEDGLKKIDELNEIFGIVPKQKISEFVELDLIKKRSGIIDAKLDERARYRKEKNWSEADRIRKELERELEKEGIYIIIQDTPNGTNWDIDMERSIKRGFFGIQE